MCFENYTDEQIIWQVIDSSGIQEVTKLNMMMMKKALLHAVTVKL